MRHVIIAQIVLFSNLPVHGQAPEHLALETPDHVKSGFSWDPDLNPVGARIWNNIHHWIEPAPRANPGMIEMFRLRDRKPAPSLVPWAGEFVGKYLISAVQASQVTGDSSITHRLSGTVADLLSTQAEDGYLGPFPKKERLLGNWDLWGHYHVIQALLLWFEATGDEGALDAAVRAGDLVCNTYLGTGRRAFDAGSQEMNLAVIHGLGLLYRKTANVRYLQMMREIEKDWERAGDYFRQGLAGVDFYRTPRPRWESLHDLQGIVELYRATGDERYKTAFVNLWRSIQRLDRHNTGGFSSGEQAIGQPYSPAPIETCCTVAWMAITVDMLRLTGESTAADELELSTLNAALGAQHPSGRWWTYNTPMDGVREASAHTIVFQSRAGTPELNCCSVNGPRSLGMLHEWAVMLDEDGVVLNYYGPFGAKVTLRNNSDISLREETSYPIDSRVKIQVEPDEFKKTFTLKLRIPQWSRLTRVTLPDGRAVNPLAGQYFPIRRDWQKDDTVTIEFDFRPRIWVGDREASGKMSIYRGPVLLAFDQHWNSFDDDAIPPLDAPSVLGGSLQADSPGSGALSPWLLVSLRGERDQEVRLCDFASAGAHGTRYRSWLPAVNLPPPPVLLDRPREGEKIPRGKALFTWGARRRPRTDLEYTVAISRSRDFSAPIFQATSHAGRVVIDHDLEPRAEHFWKVTAKNENGAAESEPRSFLVDPELPQVPESVFAALEPGPDGVILRLPEEVSFDGEKEKLVRAIPFFPSRDFSVVVRVKLKKLPEGRIAQVFSAWAKGVDDPLRITIDGGKVFARIETPGGSPSTEGAPIALGEWVHLAAVKEGTKLTLYVNGEARSSVAVPGEVDSDAETVGLGGNPNYPGNEYLAASIKDFALYARALGAEEIMTLAK